MPKKPGATPPPAQMVVVLCHDPEDGSAFIRTILDRTDGGLEGQILFGSQPVQLECLPTNPETHAGWKARVNQADVLVLLIRHMDPVSLRAARVRFGRLGDNRRAPIGVFLLRDPNEKEYKIGCSACGQKLWMSEEDKGKRGRCPNCRAAFEIPTPSDYLRERLLLPDALPILNVTIGNPALGRGALVNLLSRTAVRFAPPDQAQKEAYLKQATVPIQVEDGRLKVGAS
ncbi:MAG: hypothetical protein U1E27_09640 [Kiritimatiellia bacterium]|nr:hypothetical protein [Kiritimatiellia bacterium]